MWGGRLAHQGDLCDVVIRNRLPACRPWALGDSSLETQKKVPQVMLVFPLRSSCPAMGLAMSQARPGLFETLTPPCGARTSPLPSSPSPSLP